MNDEVQSHTTPTREDASNFRSLLIEEIITHINEWEKTTDPIETQFLYELIRIKIKIGMKRYHEFMKFNNID